MNDSMPTIQSQGPPPERHAARIIAEMTRWLVGERARLQNRMERELKDRRSGLGNPIAQRRFLTRFLAAAGNVILDAKMATGKRGRGSLMVTDWAVWDPMRERYVEPGDMIPEKAWLEAASTWMTFRRDYKPPKTHRIFFITYHALQRLAERCEARTPIDLLAAMQELWHGIYHQYHDARDDKHDLPDHLRVPVAGGIAIIERAATREFIVKTVLGPGMVDDAT